MDDLISRQAAIDAAIGAADDWDGGYNLTRADMIEKAINALPSAQPKQTVSNFIESLPTSPLLVGKMPSAQPDRSLWFRIGEICVDESKGFISSGRAVEKIRELLREAERRKE